LPRATRPGDLLVAHPLVLDLATRGHTRFAPEVSILTSTAPCPPSLWQRLLEAGAARILDIHGSSETAGLGWRDSPEAPFQLLAHWERDADSGAETQLYRRAPQAAAGQETRIGVRVPDRLAWVDDRHFHVLGRQDQAIQIGGINVFPERVRACLAAHPEVAEAWVRVAGAPPDPWLKALVVPRADCQAAHTAPARWLAALETWLAARLPPIERPRRIALARERPRDALGKATDWD
jgi:4-coumarate--CoA ligase (photoactive yellow protein activation family)